MMGFVPDYEHDIFISYARVDDLSDTGKGWISAFVEKLNIQLARKLGRMDAFSLWMDHQLAGNAPITPTIMKTLGHTAIIMIFLSKAYLASYWCQKEQNSFLRMVQNRLRQSSNIFLVELDELSKEERPAEFADLLGYQFWVCDRIGKSPDLLQPHPIGHPAYDQRYYDMLNDVSYDLANELEQIKKHVEVRSPQDIQKVETSATVFLADVTDDLQFKREEIKRYLLQQELRVLPQIEYSLEPKAFQIAVQKDLVQSDLFVQLLSEFPGKKPMDLPQGYVRCQYELASQTDIPILQWRSPELSLEMIQDASHQKFLQYGKVLAVSLGEFKAEIAKAVAAQKKPKPPSSDIGPFIFVNADMNDRKLSENICHTLEQFGGGYAEPLREGSPSEIREAFEQFVLYADAIMIIYGNVPPTWVIAQGLEVRKYLPQRKVPLRGFAIYEGPPAKKADLPFKFPGMQIINCRKSLDRQKLHTFLATLEQGGTEI